MTMLRLRNLETHVIPVIVKGQKFGSDLVFIKWEFGEISKGDLQFASSILYVSAVFQNKTGVVKVPLVCKYELSNSNVRKWLNMEEQFHNEVYTYENILPVLNTNGIVDSIFPEYYYGYYSVSRPEDDVIVLKDLRPDGFVLSEKLFLDFDHCAVAMKQLGRYHALSYLAKREKPEEFYNVVKSLKELKFIESAVEDHYHLYRNSARRAVQPFLDRNEHLGIISKFLDKFEHANDYLLSFVQPEEPVAVICHGDFCRNNVLFRYDDQDKPIDARLFDLATSRYASPAIDLSFFMFLNTTYETRQLYWDVFLKIYHDSLVETVPDVDVPSLDDVKEEMKKKAVYGFTLCSFFLPLLLEEKPCPMDYMCAMSSEERSKYIVSKGGQRGTDLVAGMFKDLVERGCII